MSAALFALLATLVAGLGARDQLLVARLTAAQGPRPVLLVVAVLSAVAAAAWAGWAGQLLLAEAPPPGRPLLVAIALVWAGIEALLARARAAPEEPTRSLFAAGTVILAQQVTDAARFLAIAIVVATALPIPAALGAAAGGAATVTLGWLLPEIAGRREVIVARRVAGGALLAAGLAVAVRALAF